MLYIKRVTIENVRCFENIDISFDLTDGCPPWTMITGDNAGGKSTLLKSIAIGLCDESSAAGLLKESDEGYIRRGKESKGAKISIQLKDKKKHGTYHIKTDIQINPTQTRMPQKERLERVRQTTFPARTFPWKKIFACGYGAGRGTSGTGDISRYSIINAVYNMFNYSEGLQNPELTIRRLSYKVPGITHLKKESYQSMLYEPLINILGIRSINLTPDGLTVDSERWGRDMPLRDLADGYKSSFLWVTDLIGWALYRDPKMSNPKDIKGIVLIDEIDQHLHPKWQREIVFKIKKQFPKIQFITTTHSPLVASSVGKMLEKNNTDKLFHLWIGDGSTAVGIDEVSADNYKGHNYDQLLASKAFDYLIYGDPDIEEIFRKASILADMKDKRSPGQNKKYLSLRKIIIDLLKSRGVTSFGRDIELGLDEEVKKQIKKLKDFL